TLRLSTRNELVKLHQRIGTTMIYVTHDQVEAMTMGERICIMNNGRLAQIGTPLEVYREPADTFVAKFLGNPPMNLIRTTLRVESDAFFADIGPTAIPVQGIAPAVAARYAGREVVLGIRPEDIYETDRDADIRKLAPLRATVVTVEALGAETLLNLDVSALENVFRARVGREANVRHGDLIEVYLDLDALYLFDPETTQSLAMSRPRTGSTPMVGAGST
ncbi:MAG: ABC transporter ATP-binding protein, partial [Hyphomicrobiales bacterium]